MQFKAKDLFADWYSSVSLKPDQNELKHRITAIEKICNNSSKDLWLDVVRLAVGIPVGHKSTRDSIITIFKNEDPAFRTQNNEELLRVLASISICFKLEKDTSYLNSLISNASIRCNFLGQYEPSTNNPFLELAAQYSSAISISERENDPEADIKDLYSLQQELSESEDDDEAVISYTQAKVITNSIVYLIHNNSVLSEESNTFWWLFNAFSRTLKQGFEELSIENMIALTAKELYELTGFGSEMPSAKHFLRKALVYSNKGKSITKRISAFDVINSLTSTIKVEIVSGYNDKMADFTPCLSAIKKSLDYEQDGYDWSLAYRKLNHDGNIKQLFEPVNLAHQLYGELMLTKLWQQIK